VESALLHYLNETLLAFPLLQLGLPETHDPEYQSARDPGIEGRCVRRSRLDDLMARLPPDVFVRTE